MAAGLVTAEGISQALAHQKITGHRLGDCLAEIGAIEETVLLKFLATELNTRFVSSDKLAKVKIPAEVLEKIPVRMAEMQYILPLSMDPETRHLSVVMAEPQNEDLVREVALVAEAKEISAFVA